MTTTKRRTDEGSWTQDLGTVLRSWRPGRRRLWLLAGTAIIAGLSRNWSRLVAIGIASSLRLPAEIAAVPSQSIGEHS